ncbi:MAG: hypothetical protein KDD97_08510 [Rhodobacteraceae bacterium]|nr:hypothetical protein [Paracoccaceae bacterium]
MLAKTLSFLAALFLAAALSFFAGMWTTYKTWWPWQKVEEVQEAWRSWRATGMVLPLDTYPLRRPDAPNESSVIHDAAASAKGYWVINRFDGPTGRYVLDLLDEKGEVVSTRPIDYSRIKPDGDPGEFAHIATMLPDGSVLVVWDDAPGMARLDACGDPVWSKTDQIYHHSIEKGVDGYWTWQSAIWNGGEDQRMIRFDPETGDILESIDLIDDVIAKSPRNRLLMEIPEGYEFDRTTHYGDREDLFHPNDLEELLPEMAAAFPQFEAGDLLVSMRNMDMLAVIGRKTGEIKWAQYGPWLHQHDADFHPDGTITVFSNNVDRFRSEIIQVDPKTGESRNLFEGKDVSFDSYIMGKHQKLPNGNWMIDSTMQGRVLEVTPDGRLVREYNNILDDRHNSLVLYSEFLKPGYLTTVPQCGK